MVAVVAGVWCVVAMMAVKMVAVGEMVKVQVQHTLQQT